MIAHHTVCMRYVLVIFLLAGPVHAADPNLGAEKIRALIEQLAISNDPAGSVPILSPSRDTPKADSRVIAIGAERELSKIGFDAFPFLLDHLDDNRQSIMARAVVPQSVGLACYDIIVGQLYNLPVKYANSGSIVRKGADGKTHLRPVWQKDFVAMTGVKKWLLARDGNTLSELQLETTIWVLAEEERIGVAKPEDETNILVPLRTKVAELRQQVNAEQQKTPRHTLHLTTTGSD